MVIADTSRKHGAADLSRFGERLAEAEEVGEMLVAGLATATTETTMAGTRTIDVTRFKNLGRHQPPGRGVS
jgi:hypothetical protein